MNFFFVQFLNGLASASSLFLVAAGLSLIFGVTRVVNFAHGSLFMLGAFTAFSVSQIAGFWTALLVAPLVVAVFGALLEISLLRRIYQAPELFQLLATFGAVLVIGDLTLLIWGPEDRLGPRAPGLSGAIEIFGLNFPQYELFLIAVGPLVLAAIWLLLRRTRWGILVRAATADREMVGALGVNQKRLFTSVFALGALLAGLGGALQLPRSLITHGMDLAVIVEAFVVVVVGGLGSVTGAFLAALLLGLVQAFGIVWFPQSTLVLIFLAMAVVLALRPQGLLGKPELAVPHAAPEPTILPLRRRGKLGVALLLLALALLPGVIGPYEIGVMTEVLIFALFAVSLQFITGLGGIVSFGHAAFFGLGAYAAALALRSLGAPMILAIGVAPVVSGVLAWAFARFAMRLSGVYLAMLTLAFAQILHATAFQWYAVTGGDNGILGVWPAPWVGSVNVYYWLVLALAGLAILGLRRIAFAPFGYGLRAVRDSSLRAAAVGIDTARQRRLAFALAGMAAGLGGALYAFLKGSVFPDVLAIPTSVDALVMMLLGGVQTPGGPVLGAAVYKILHAVISSWTDYWRLVLGLIIIAAVLLFPQGLMGIARKLRERSA